jgi:hypothetical protein
MRLQKNFQAVLRFKLIFLDKIKELFDSIPAINFKQSLFIVAF